MFPHFDPPFDLKSRSWRQQDLAKPVAEHESTHVVNVLNFIFFMYAIYQLLWIINGFLSTPNDCWGIIWGHLKKLRYFMHEN